MEENLYLSADLPMVFGTETEFGFSYGRVLNEEKAAFFPSDFTDKVFNLIIKIVAEKTGAFVRDPISPWERGGLNHLGPLGVKILTEAALSDNLDDKKLPAEGISCKDIYRGMVGIFLPNGSRLYIDNDHLEYSISECREPYEVICQERAMERILTEAVTEAQKICGREIFLFKNNTDHKGNSYGCHENYLLRSEFFSRLYEKNLWSSAWLSFVTTSIIYTGSGKVGHEYGEPCFYQISQRADHVRKIFGSCSVANRPIIHYRPESLADPQKWGRFHVILDDSNMSEWSIFLKIGTKALILNMLQSQYFNSVESWFEKDDNEQYEYLFLGDPVEALKFISRDLTCKKSLGMNSSGASALEIQKEWLALVKNFYFFRHGYEAMWISDVIEKWEQVLTWIEEDNPILNSVLDWRIKRQLVESYLEKRSRTQAVSLEAAQSIDIRYHDIGHGGFYNRLSEINRLVENFDINKARTDSSPKTRAWLRSRFMKWMPHLTDVSWELLIFELQFGDFKSTVRLYPDPLFIADFKIKLIFETENYDEFCRKFLHWHLNCGDLY